MQLVLHITRMLPGNKVSLAIIPAVCIPPVFFGSLYAKYWPSWLLETPLIIAHNGASGVFAGCTDLAYQKAIEDGADVLDCSVQMSKDGVPFCLDSADLMGDTTAMATFMPRSSMVPEIQKNKGIFSFDLTWSEIQSLKRKDSVIHNFCISISYRRSHIGYWRPWWLTEA